MRIVVPLRRVLDPAGIVAHRRLRRLFVNRETYDIQPGDHGALEAALRIKDDGVADVVVVSGQPEPDDDTLRRGLAMGADSALYLSGDGFARADDAVVACALRCVIERMSEVALVVSGGDTLDTGQGQLGARLAEALGWPLIRGAWRVEVRDGRVRAVCRDSDQYLLVEADLPAMVQVAPNAFKPRYPNGARLINVYRGEGEMADALERWEVSDLLPSDALSPLVEIVGRDFPPERQRGERLEGTAEEVAAVMAEVLRQRVRRASR